MTKRYCELTILLLLLSSTAGVAQGQAPAAPGEPATPTTIIENAQSRIVRVDILASSTRSMHNHPDMLWHVFVTMDAPIILTIQGEANPVKLGPWQSHFFKGGTTHAITNPSPRQVQFLEFFSKKTDAAASVDDARDLLLALAGTALQR
jgi:oxalate decarboxylase/phosphoglucose isomerase-like protein (cupin superfamily)